MTQWRKTTPTVTANASPRTRFGDPWRAPETTGKTAEGAPWLLSYLDVMTILFAFFVLLFAYQRAITPSGAKASRPAATATRTAPTVATPNPADPTRRAIAAMHEHAAGHAIYDSTSATDSASSPVEPPESKEAMTAQAVLKAARLTADDAAERIAGLLAAERTKPPVDVVRDGSTLRLEIGESVLFAPASAELKGDGEKLLARLLPVLQEAQRAVIIEGHSDPSPIANGHYPSNWELSAARAAAVARFLIGRQVPPDRLRAVGFADTRPRADNTSAEGRAKNRRVTLILDAAVG